LNFSIIETKLKTLLREPESAVRPIMDRRYITEIMTIYRGVKNAAMEKTVG